MVETEMVEEGLVGIIIGAIVVALLFDFVNGFHNSARVNIEDRGYCINCS
jgi:hypothetical protein